MFSSHLAAGISLAFVALFLLSLKWEGITNVVGVLVGFVVLAAAAACAFGWVAMIALGVLHSHTAAVPNLNLLESTAVAMAIRLLFGDLEWKTKAS